MNSKKCLSSSDLLGNNNVDKKSHDISNMIYYDSVEGLARALATYLLENDIENEDDDDFFLMPKKNN